MKNKTTLMFAIIFVSLALIGIISAAGISSPYWKDYPLYMNYGETKVINFNLQNMVGDKDITVEVTLKQGSNIATLEKTTYTAKAGTHDTMIPLTITIPEDYRGGIQRIELEVKTVEQGTGMVVLGTGWISSFNVIVSEKITPARSTLTGIIVALIIALIILAIVILTLLRRKRK